jgi:hypothetical protein
VRCTQAFVASRVEFGAALAELVDWLGCTPYVARTHLRILGGDEAARLAHEHALAAHLAAVNGVNDDLTFGVRGAGAVGVLAMLAEAARIGPDVGNGCVAHGSVNGRRRGRIEVGDDSATSA